MKVINSTLFSKFAIVATILVVLFSVFNLYILWQTGYKSFENEIDKRSKVLCRIIAEKALQPIVYDDYVNVYKIVDQIKSNDSTIAYIFILDENNTIITQNYNIKIPYALIDANKLKDDNYQIKLIEAKNFQYKSIRDIAYPILGGKLGTIRIGFIEEDIRDSLNKVVRKMIILVVLFLIFGLVVAFLFSLLIISPIKRISRKAQKINLQSIDVEYIDHRPLQFRKIFNYYITDEMDILFKKFTEMLDRLKENKKELQAARDSYIQAEKMASIGTLTAGISHEINNPLAGIKNCMSRIEKEPENVKQNIRYIELINDAIDKMEGIVKPLLSFSRKSELKFVNISIGKLLDNALNLVDYRVKKSSIEVIKNYDHDINVFVSVNHIEQVLINLLINGLDAVEEKKVSQPDHKGQIRIKVTTTAKYTDISIKDNGIGIEKDKLLLIFDPFFTTKVQGKGTGLGLYVSYNIIKDLGGKLVCKSNFGESTEFILSIKNNDVNESIRS